MLVVMLFACLPKYAGPAAPATLAHWTQSEEAMPEDHLRPPANQSRLFRYQSATPTGPADLYARVQANSRTVDALKRSFWVCRVSQIDPASGLTPTPDMRVKFTIADRTASFASENQTGWPFSLGLVDLEPGQKIAVEVTEDQLGSDRLLLDAEERFDGTLPLRWTKRSPGRPRTSLECKVLPPSDRDAVIAERLSATWKAIQKAERGKSPIPLARAELQGLAAVVGWSDPRVQYLLERVGEPADSGGSSTADVSSEP